MTATQTLPETVRDDARLLAWDLAWASGMLSEIATTWRRSGQDIPHLPLGLPVRLQEAARQLAADARSLPRIGPGEAALLAGQLATLSAGTAAARAVTCGRGSDGIGDALLWESLTAALRRAAARLPVTSRAAARLR